MSSATRTPLRTAHDRELIQRQIDATDRQIDALVYQLYGLTRGRDQDCERELKG